MSKKEDSLLSLKDEGEFLFVFSDKFKVYYIYRDIVKNKLYRLTTDKYFTLESADLIIVPNGFMEYKGVKFFKPYVTQEGVTFVGIVEINGEHKKFNIDLNDDLVYKETVSYVSNTSFPNKGLADIDVTFYIQKRNRLYLLGKDLTKKEKDNVFGIFNMEDDVFEKLYYVYTDKGNINLTSLNIDEAERKVYLVGSETTDKTYPYLEQVLYR